MTACVLGLPSKGRLQEQTLAFLEDCGLGVRQNQGERGYTAQITGSADIDVQLMSATEIAKALVAGEIHAGVTGEDVLREAEPELGGVSLIKPLGFGRADLVVAVPAGWLDVRSMSDLVDVCAAHRARTGKRLRVATKFLRLAGAFLEAHTLGDYRLVESAGATEGAPAAGSAEIIVDITTTGRTLAANGLTVLSDGMILRSQAHLAVSRAAIWPAPAKAAFERFLEILEARLFAQTRALLRVEVPPSARDEALAAWQHLWGSDRPVPSLDGLGFYCPNDGAVDAARALAPFATGPVGLFLPRFLFGGPAPGLQRFRAVFEEAS